MPPKIAGLSFAPGSSKPAKPKPTSKPVLGPPVPPPHGAIGPPAPPQTPARPAKKKVHPEALTRTFDHQPRAVRDRIVQNALRHHTPEGDVILKHIGSSGMFYGRGGSSGTSFAERALSRLGSDIAGSLRPNPLPYPTPQERLHPKPSPLLADVQSGLQSVSRFLTTKDAQLRHGQQGVQTAGFTPGPLNKLATNAAKDALNLPAEAIPSVYLPASKAASGDVGGAAKMLAQPYVELAKHPLKSFSEHPLNNALLLYGPASGASRGIGAVGRRAGIPAFSTERAPAVVPGTALAKVRSYSRDPAVKAYQVWREHTARKQAGKLEEQARTVDIAAQKAPHLSAQFESKAADLRRQAAEKNPDVMSAHDISKVMDDLEGVNQAIRAANINAVTKPVRAMNKENAPAGHAASVIAQSIVSPTTRDIATYLDELKRIHDSGALTPAEMSANRTLRAGLEKAVENAKAGKFDPAQVRQSIERSYGPLVKRLQAKLAEYGMLPAERAARAELIPFASRKMGAHRAPERDVVIVGRDGDVRLPLPTIVDRTGRELSNERIRAQMAAEGHPEPFFVTQAPNTRGARNFYSHWASAKATVGAQARSGQATIKGTFDAHPETMVEQVARMQGMIDAHEGFARAMSQGVYRKDGKVAQFGSKARAETVKANLDTLPGSPGWRVVSLRPWHGRAEDVRSVVDGIVPESEAAQSVAQILTDALDAKGEGPFALVPEQFARRMQDHINVLGAGGGLKLWRLASGAFRKTVLATSPTWLAGNAVEAYVRTGIYRATPADAVFASRVAREIERTDPEAAMTFRMRAQQGGLMGFTKSTVRTASDQFKNSDPKLAKIARLAGTFWRTPGPKQLADLWHGYTDFVFGGLNQAVELPPQLMMTGAYMRRRFGISQKNMLTSSKAVEQAAKGMLSTPEQIAMAEAVRRAYGQYFSFSPAERQVISLYTPFASWSLNSLRFLYKVMPQDHPVLTALIADANLASEEWRKQHGLDLFMGKGSLPGFLQGSIPTSLGGHFRGFTRYTPFGFGGQPLDTIAGLVLPQINGVQAAFQGRDWTGKELRNPDGTPYDQLQLFKYGVEQLATSMIPVVGRAGSVSKGGLRSLNPFAITPGRKKAGITWGSGLPGGGGGPVGGGGPTGGSGPVGGVGP